MDYRHDYWGLYGVYYRDPFRHSPLSTRELRCKSSVLHGKSYWDYARVDWDSVPRGTLNPKPQGVQSLGDTRISGLRCRLSCTVSGMRASGMRGSGVTLNSKLRELLEV